MNKLLNFVQGGATKLPPGFRFQPTDEEIVYEYLIRKTFSYPLPASVVPEIPDIYKFDPWDMPGNEEQDSYFFTKKKVKNGNRVNRTTASGYWKAIGSEKRIECLKKSRDTNTIMGMRKTLVFHIGKSPNVHKTEWLMHEYRLVSSSEADGSCNFQNNNLAQKTLVQVGDWFLCHVFLKKQRKEDVASDNANEDRKVYDLMRTDLNDSSAATSSSSSSCGSSSITDVTSVMKNRRSYYTTEI